MYHGVELCRDSVLERLELVRPRSPTSGCCVGVVVVAVVIAGRTFTRRLYAVRGDAMSTVTITATSGLRIIPGAMLDLRRPQRMLERSLMVTRRNWMIVFGGFFEPLFYLLSIRIGMSSSSAPSRSVVSRSATRSSSHRR